MSYRQMMMDAIAREQGRLDRARTALAKIRSGEVSHFIEDERGRKADGNPEMIAVYERTLHHAPPRIARMLEDLKTAKRLGFA